MVRFAIIGVIVGVALILYALVDAAMSDAARARGVSKPVWVVLIVVLPVIGAILWFTIGRARGPEPVPERAPDDDPRFTGTTLSSSEIDAHMEELEARLRELDNEVFPSALDGKASEGKASEGGGVENGGAEKGATENGGATPETESDPTGDVR